MLLKVFSVATAIKLVLIPAYKSTDFEVHRNWMAITHSLPLKKWYTDNTSEWTLDYPPLFAWFEFALSYVASFFDQNMLVVENLNYSSFNTLLFMRLSVIVSDLVLVFGCKSIADWIRLPPIRKCSRWKSMWSSPVSIFYMLVLNNAGLLIVDHVHFQYNGFLFGILLLSIASILRGRYISATVWFSILINLKHLFLYMAPVFFVYTLKNYCFNVPNVGKDLKTVVGRIFRLSLIVFLISSISFGPFILLGQLKEVLSRLFPFKRGLCHSYWAPNFWALYNVCDKVLVSLVRFLFEKPTNFAIVDRGISYLYESIRRKHSAITGSMTSGVLQHYEHLMLPSITPAACAVLVLLSSLPCLLKLWRSPQNPLHFVRALVLSTICAYFFGWHVHEKAVLMIIIPMSLMAVLQRKEAETYIVLSTLGHFSILPLIFTDEELIVKYMIFFLFFLYVVIMFSDNIYDLKSLSYFPMPMLKEYLYLLGIPIILIYEHIIQFLFNWDKRYPFMPLLIISTYCALGIGYIAVKYYLNFLSMNEKLHKLKTF